MYVSIQKVLNKNEYKFHEDTFIYQTVFQFRRGENHDENYTGSKLQTGNQLFGENKHFSKTHSTLYEHTSLLQNMLQRKKILCPSLFINTCTGGKSFHFHQQKEAIYFTMGLEWL